MKDIYPDIYKKAIEKYKGREHIMKDAIPILNCLWNDVLHFSPVHPLRIKEAFEELGEEFMGGREYFEIPVDTFAPEKTIIYLNGGIPKTDSRNWLSYDSALVPRYKELPELSRRYYKEKFAKNEQPLLYAKISHVLYRGSIDTKNITRIRI
jgi:hypothetical protein